MICFTPDIVCNNLILSPNKNNTFLNKYEIIIHSRSFSYLLQIHGKNKKPIKWEVHVRFLSPMSTEF